MFDCLSGCCNSANSAQCGKRLTSASAVTLACGVKLEGGKCRRKWRGWEDGDIGGRQTDRHTGIYVYREKDRVRDTLVYGMKQLVFDIDLLCGVRFPITSIIFSTPSFSSLLHSIILLIHPASTPITTPAE